MQTIKLNNGIECPVIGLGTFMLSPADAQKSTREALKMGYRLIDTANAYVNERAVGRGIKESGVARNEVFLSKKLWPSEYENPGLQHENILIGTCLRILKYARIFSWWKDFLMRYLIADRTGRFCTV